MAKSKSQAVNIFKAFPKNRLFDSHCHLESLPGYLKPHIEAAVASGVSNIVTVGVDIETSLKGLQIQHKYPEIVLAGIGLQPEIVIPGSELFDASITSLNVSDFMKRFEKTLLANDFKLIGECGLDYYWLERNEDLSKVEVENSKYLQSYMLQEQLKLAQLFNLPVSLHSRAAEKDCIEACRPFAHKLPIVFHSFTGTVDQAKEIVSMGFKIGINGIVTYKSANVIREFIIDIVGSSKIDSIADFYDFGFYLETDSPLLFPSNSRLREAYNTPKQLPYIWEFITKLISKSN